MISKATDRQVKAVASLVQQGASTSGAIALIANFSWECGSPNLPSAFRDPGKSRLDHGSQGLPQWRLSRLTDYQRFVAAKHPDLDQTDFGPDGDLWPWFGRLDYQLEYIVVELKGSYSSLWSKLRIGGDVAALTADVCWQYERPSKALAHLSDRVGYAKVIAATLVKTKVVKTDLPVHLAAEADLHDKTQAGSVGIMGTSALAAVGFGLVPFAHSMPWYGWVLVGLLGFVFLLGLVGFVSAHIAATNVKAASAAVTPDAKPASPAVALPRVTAETSGPVAKDPFDPAVQAAKDKADRHKAQAELAAKGEKAALAKAVTPAPAEPAPEAK